MGNVSPVATTETGSHATQQDVPAEPLIDLEGAGERSTGEPRAARGVVAEAQLAGGASPSARSAGGSRSCSASSAIYLYARSAGVARTAPQGAKALAAQHGKDLFNFEKAIHVDWEKGLQHALLPYKGFMQVVGGFYGGAHFAVTIGVLVWMLFKRPQFYRFWRTVLFVLTMAAVGIFALYPAEPPRLLKDSSGHPITVDTLSKIGGLWSYNHGVIEHISDPYAPMPSLHLGWSTWVAAALWFTIPALTWRKRARDRCLPGGRSTSRS